MRSRGLVSVLATLCLAVTVSAAAELPYEGASFKRVTLVVADMDRSLKIYRDVLGFDLDGISESSEESYSYPVFKIDPGAKLRFATLSAGSAQVRTLALVEATGIELPRPGRPLMTATVIRVDDLDATFKQLEEMALETTEQKTSGRPGEFTFRERAFIDFDGHLIVLYEILEVVDG